MIRKMKELVSITIPTYNSERTLRKTLESVKAQTYKKIEIIVIDSHSKDETYEIAKKFGAKVFQYEGTLLGARALGIEKAKGEFILLLDSDQILRQRTIETAVMLMKKYDMLWLYERSYKPKKLLEKLYDADRKLVQKYWKNFINPVGGVILPRFYKKDILKKAFSEIPEKILPLCVAHDHAIIYYEARKISNEICNVGNEKNPAVWHMEPWGWLNLFKKTYRYGVTTKKLVENNVYPNIIKSKNKMRSFYSSDILLSVQSNLLRVMRGIPYKLGYYFKR